MLFLLFFLTTFHKRLQERSVFSRGRIFESLGYLAQTSHNSIIHNTAGAAAIKKQHGASDQSTNPVNKGLDMFYLHCQFLGGNSRANSKHQWPFGILGTFWKTCCRMGFRTTISWFQQLFYRKYQVFRSTWDFGHRCPLSTDQHSFQGEDITMANILDKLQCCVVKYYIVTILNYQITMSFLWWYRQCDVLSQIFQSIYEHKTTWYWNLKWHCNF